ncbi:MAG: DUF934 domain-containing protein [Pseudomonadota bacterium]
MNILVTDTGFQKETQPHAWVTYMPDMIWSADIYALEVPVTTDTQSLYAHLDNISHIRIPFAKFSDGRGYTLARQLRLLGYREHLRAVGELLPDQYAIARQVGFDAIELTPEQATRHPEACWQIRTDWSQHDYQARLGYNISSE